MSAASSNSIQFWYYPPDVPVPKAIAMVENYRRQRTLAETTGAPPPADPRTYKTVSMKDPIKIARLYSYVRRVQANEFKTLEPYPFFKIHFDTDPKSYIAPEMTYMISVMTSRFIKGLQEGSYLNVDRVRTDTGIATFVMMDYHYEKPWFIGYAVNKIHLFPKDEFILYAILKLDNFMTKVLAKYPDNNVCFKFTFQTASNRRITAEDNSWTGLNSNGGLLPTIVIYTSSVPEINDFMLRSVIALFAGQEDTMGALDMNYPLDVSPFNARISSLLSYSAGDRGTTLDAMIDAKATRRDPSSYGYTIPKWLTHRQRECATLQDKLNKETRTILGFNVCKNGKPIDLAASCRVKPLTDDKKFCFLEKADNPLTDPFQFTRPPEPPAPHPDDAQFNLGSGGRRRATRRRRRRRSRRSTLGR